MPDKPPFILVDGSSYLYRAFHAMPNLSTAVGLPTGAIYGVANMLRKLITDYEPRYVAVVFDAKGKTFRNDVYKEYKANRPPMPDELREQVGTIHEIVDAMGLPRLMIDGVEADDVIGTLATQASDQHMDTLISTGDKDLAQLVDDHVTLINTMNDTLFDRDGVKKKFGVPPEGIVDYLMLVGDSSDNIPGVPKVGPKTAVKWLAEYGSLDELVSRAGEMDGKVGENLREAIDQFPMTRELVTIRRNVELEQVPKDLERRPPDRERLRALFTKLEFRPWLDALGDHEPEEGEAQTNYETLTDKESFAAWLDRLAEAPLFAFDTETTSLNAIEAQIVGVSFSDEKGAAYVPVAHRYPGAPQQLDRAYVLDQLKPLLEDPNRKKVAQNLKYDMSVLAQSGIRVRSCAFDTMLESYVLDSTASRHDMDSLALKYLGRKTIKYEDVAGKGKSQIGFDEVPLEQAGPYAAEDADITLRLHNALWPRLKEHAPLMEVFETIEMPLVPVLSRVERNGVRLDGAMLKRQSRKLAGQLLEIERQAHDEAGQPFNISSPKQIQEILYGEKKMPVIQKTPKGQPSTAEGVLEELAALGHRLPQLILEHRALNKLKSTYTDKLPQMIHPRTGRVHTSYHQAVAATGRLSSSDPNLQNIPVRSAEGRRIREAFIADPGFRILAADYSQIELRIMAHLSGDARLRQAFASSEDVHRATAAEVFGCEPDAVSREQRRAAKAINFGLIYGMSAFGLARQLKIERSDAQEYVKLYFERYPGVKDFMDATRERAREQGYVETVYGRRLYLPEIKASNHARRQYAERTAINAPMQGTAADLIKRAMIRIDQWLEDDTARMIMQVHDELVLEVRADVVDEVMARVHDDMIGVATLDVPLEVDVSVGENWNEAHP